MSSYNVVANVKIQIVKHSYSYTIWVGDAVYKRELSLSQVDAHLKDVMDDVTKEIKKHA